MRQSDEHHLNNPLLNTVWPYIIALHRALTRACLMIPRSQLTLFRFVEPESLTDKFQIIATCCLRFAKSVFFV